MGKNKRTRKRVLAFLLASTFFFVMIYITIYESEHCLHECCEKHCPICQELSVIDSVLKQTLLVLPLLISFLIAILYQEWHSPISFSDLWKRTLILDKVRIDD